MFIRQYQRNVRIVARKFSELAAVPKTEGGAISAPLAQPIKEKGGSTFFQRFSAFLAGCGVGFGVSAYFVYNELIESNEKLASDIRKISK